jgi:hypothetical protein
MYSYWLWIPKKADESSLNCLETVVSLIVRKFSFKQDWHVKKFKEHTFIQMLNNLLPLLVRVAFWLPAEDMNKKFIMYTQTHNKMCACPVELHSRLLCTFTSLSCSIFMAVSSAFCSSRRDLCCSSPLKRNCRKNLQKTVLVCILTTRKGYLKRNKPFPSSTDGHCWLSWRVDFPVVRSGFSFFQ